MNFSEWLYFLENATVAQTLKVGTPIDKIAASQIVNLIKSGLQQRFATQDWLKNPKFLSFYSNWMTFWYMEHILRATPMWNQLQASFRSKDRRATMKDLQSPQTFQRGGGANSGMAFEKSVSDLINGHSVAQSPGKYAQQRTDAVRDYLAANWYHVTSEFNKPEFTPEHLEELSEGWHELLAAKESVPASEDFIPLIKLKGQWKGWQWVKLDRSSCGEERDAMQHCGNAGGHPDDRILSLRDPENYAHLTFIIRHGTLGEMKGRGNHKPTKVYHAPIVELLKSNHIKTMRGGGYKPENNFQLEDLGKDKQEALLKKKPYLDKPFEYYTEQGSHKDTLAFLTDLFDYSFEKIYKDAKSSEVMVLVETFKTMSDLHDTIQHGEEVDVDDFSFIDNEMDHWDAWPRDGWYDEQYGYEYAADNKTEEIVERIFELRWHLYKEYVDEEEWEDMSFSEKLEVDEKAVGDEGDIHGESALKMQLDRAHETGQRDGTYDAAWKSVESAFDGRGTWFEVEIHRGDKYLLLIPMSAMKDLYYSKVRDNEDYYVGNFEKLIDLPWSSPQDGFNEFSEKWFNETFQDEMAWYLKEAEKNAKESSQAKKAT
tara:strand:- start:826 stop:2619 length:1794 start_codon:yes stop_codon:yes gene_type:complete